MQMYKVEISIYHITVCFLNRKKRQQMIKRRTKRQQQKGRKEPKAKMKLNKRMLKKKTTLKTEIPKLMRYFSYSKHGNNTDVLVIHLQELTIGSPCQKVVCFTAIL